MADTIEGGAYRNTDGEWIDAEGKPLEGDKLSEAKAAAAKQQAADKAAFAAENERRKAANLPPLPEPIKAPEAKPDRADEQPVRAVVQPPRAPERR